MFAAAVSYTTIAPGIYVTQNGWTAWAFFFAGVSSGKNASVMWRDIESLETRRVEYENGEFKFLYF